MFESPRAGRADDKVLPSAWGQGLRLRAAWTVVNKVHSGRSLLTGTGSGHPGASQPAKHAEN